MEMIINSMLGKKTWAVIGATQTVDKFGHIIYKRLKSAGYEVFPVNPKYDSILADTCYKTLSDLPVVPEAISFVVGPDKGKAFVDEAVRLGVKQIWFQPGAYDVDLVHYARDLGMEVVYQSCVLIELTNRGK